MPRKREKKLERFDPEDQLDAEEAADRRRKRYDTVAKKLSRYRPEYARIATKLCDEHGMTDREIADYFGVHPKRLYFWRVKYPEFRAAMQKGKAAADDRVVESLYQRARGYDREAVKIFMPAGKSEPVYASYLEHIPADPTSIQFWLMNRQPELWRNRQEHDHRHRHLHALYGGKSRDELIGEIKAGAAALGLVLIERPGGLMLDGTVVPGQEADGTEQGEDK